MEHCLANRVAVQRIAKRFNVSRDALNRHCANHMPATLRAALMSSNGVATVIDLEKLRKDESEGILQTLIWQKADLLLQMDVAKANMDPIAHAKYHDLLLKNTQTIAKLVGELATHTRTVTNNFLIAPEYLELRRSILDALDSFPDARKAVAMKLQALEHQPRPRVLEHAAQ
jgi:hypothetical protein